MKEDKGRGSQHGKGSGILEIDRADMTGGGRKKPSSQ